MTLDQRTDGAVGFVPYTSERLIDEGRAFEDNGNLPAAIGKYKMAVCLNPQYRPAYNALIDALLDFKEGKPDWVSERINLQADFVAIRALENGVYEPPKKVIM